jgi:carbonic anhydrase
VTLIDDLLAANGDAPRPVPLDQRPLRRLAVVTCMDARIDVFAVLGLRLGDAHVIRNAGGRLTDDVLRSLTLSSNVLGVDTLVVMQHTRCGLAGTSDAELRSRTGADLDFLPIADHEASLRADIERLASTAYLSALRTIAGFLYDVDSGRVQDIVRWSAPPEAAGTTPDVG